MSSKKNNKIPSNYTEAEVIDIINNVANRLASKFRFGYHSVEDIKQQARLFAWEGLDGYDGIRPLENFLWTHVRNRLYNYKRNNYERPDKPCLNCKFYKDQTCQEFTDTSECSLFTGWLTRNTAKKNLMTTIDISLVRTETESTSNEVSSDNEIFNLVDNNVPSELREDWLRLVYNLRLSKNRKDKLVIEIYKILEQFNINIEDFDL
jgi:DNA-directed RNA polymerase specialized sigma24 family protein